MKKQNTSFLNRKLFAVLSLSGALILSGCASTGSSFLSDDSSADPRLTQGSDAQFFSKSGFQACAAGASVAVLACMVSNSSNKAGCAIAAGVAACGVAMGGNYYLDQRRSQYSNTNERLQVMTTDVQEDTQRIVARTETAYAVISDDKKRLAEMEQQQAVNALNAEEAKKELQQIDQNIAVLNRDLDNMNKKVGEYQKVATQERADGADTAAMAQVDAEIAKMERQVSALHSEVESLYDQRNAIKLG